MIYVAQLVKYNPLVWQCLWKKDEISQTNVVSVSSVFNDTGKVKVLSLHETIKENRFRL